MTDEDSMKIFASAAFVIPMCLHFVDCIHSSLVLSEFTSSLSSISHILGFSCALRISICRWCNTYLCHCVNPNEYAVNSLIVLSTVWYHKLPGVTSWNVKIPEPIWPVVERCYKQSSNAVILLWDNSRVVNPAPAQSVIPTPGFLGILDFHPVVWPLFDQTPMRRFIMVIHVQLILVLIFSRRAILYSQNCFNDCWLLAILRPQ